MARKFQIPLDFKTHFLVITAAQFSSYFHIADQIFSICYNWIHNAILSSGLIYYLLKKIILNYIYKIMISNFQRN